MSDAQKETHVTDIEGVRPPRFQDASPQVPRPPLAQHGRLLPCLLNFYVGEELAAQAAYRVIVIVEDALVAWERKCKKKREKK